MTAAGYVLGTPHYMSPEQAAGKAVDHRADLYSLGVILYEMLAGEVPFGEASTTSILVKLMTEMPEPPSRRRRDVVVPAALEAIAMRCLEKDPDRRFQSADRVRRGARFATSRRTDARSRAGCRSPDVRPRRAGPGSRRPCSLPRSRLWVRWRSGWWSRTLPRILQVVSRTSRSWRNWRRRRSGPRKRKCRPSRADRGAGRLKPAPTSAPAPARGPDPRESARHRTAAAFRSRPR